MDIVKFQKEIVFYIFLMMILLGFVHRKNKIRMLFILIGIIHMDSQRPRIVYISNRIGSKQIIVLFPKRHNKTFQKKQICQLLKGIYIWLVV